MTTEPSAGSTQLWRDPSQQRSRIRVERMLEVAKGLLGDRGLEGLTMEGVAQGARVPIGSLYQFFPDRNALLARLFSQLLDTTDGFIKGRFREVDSAASFAAAAEGLAESLYLEIAADPARIEIWSAVRAIRSLRHLLAEDSERNARVVFKAARTFAPDSVPDERLFRACSLVCNLLGSVTQTAVEQGGRDGELLVEEYAEMVRVYLRSVLRNHSNHPPQRET